ncbi:uncharacterized protein BO66DRAFT_443239 [Aspergillus aculeatinus CBS 121060]|uniref:Uncharacterized protein n=1 Tax=Aspergillus aculeatinus CBS 121060 TaxID=1448322 RepID=A0ACD1GVF3_9EURO|nr:hypothetical protein BO66DRAFT_443239 [Aspergillus aculeatinus CBS 121060]RAH65246.1 hypothetical protein BO66DRAFT_443239 [Aspergillus aculeatinus CBS 121060]
MPVGTLAAFSTPATSPLPTAVSDKNEKLEYRRLTAMFHLRELWDGKWHSLPTSRWLSEAFQDTTASDSPGSRTTHIEPFAYPASLFTASVETSASEMMTAL